MGTRFTPGSERMKTYTEVRRLVESGMVDRSEVKRELVEGGFLLPSRMTLTRWIAGKTSPFTGKNLFIPTPSEKLSFFVGAWLGDGWADDNDGGKRLRLKVRSRAFAEEFADAATAVLGKELPYRVWTTEEEDGIWYNVKATSYSLYDFVTRPLPEMTKYTDEFPSSFLRGVLTAEGSPSVNISARHGPRLNLGIDFSNSDVEFVTLVRSLFGKAGYSPGKPRVGTMMGTKTNLGVANQTNWIVSLSRASDVRRFASEIGFADESKQTKLEDAISLIDRTGPVTAAVLWTKSYAKQDGVWVRKLSIANASASL